LGAQERKQSDLKLDRISNWPSRERPRERLIAVGAQQLTDAELLAVILRVGTGSSRAGVRGETAVTLARSLLADFQGLSGLDRADVRDLLQVRGLSTAKVSQIKAAFELGKRVRSHVSSLRSLESSAAVAEYLSPRLASSRNEIVVALFLDGQNHLLSDKVISEGIVMQAEVPTRRILEEALRTSATSIVLVHNHPSGNAEPSSGDDETTYDLDKGASLLGLVMIDHVIIGGEEHYSYADSGRLEELRAQKRYQEL
jgi:DNA repair protein RadC